MELVVFIVLQLVNVILSTVKSVVTVKSKASVACLVNALYFTLYYYIIKAISDQDTIIVLVVSFLTNLIGVYIGKKIMDYFEKEKLWIYHSYIRCTVEKAMEIKARFEELDCYCVYQEVKENKFYNLTIFANTKEKSRVVIKELDRMKATFYVTESMKG